MGERGRKIAVEGNARAEKGTSRNEPAGGRKTERARYNRGLVSGITDGVRQPPRVNTVARLEPLILLRLFCNHVLPSSTLVASSSPSSPVSLSSSSYFAFLTAPYF